MTERNFTEFQDSIGFQDRRQRTEDALLVHIQELSKEIREVKAQFAYHHATYVESTEKAVAKAMSEAFPDGDPHGHRRHHEIVIAAAQRRLELWDMLKKETAKWGLLGFLGWAGYALWQAFLLGPRK
jgi:hypothetical protein